MEVSYLYICKQQASICLFCKREHMRHANQYSQSDFRPLYLMIGIGLIGASLWAYGEVNIIKSMEPISPMGTMIVKAQEPAPQPTTRPLTIENYIEDKFGDDADKAMLLLQGEGCSENKLLSPQAVNDNRTWGGVGRDRGYWQINDVYHPSVSDWCASD